MTAAIRIGAIAWMLWGLLHAAVGLSALIPASRADMGAALSSLAGAAPAAASDGLDPAVQGLIANHAFNLLWGGIFAFVVAITLNWRGSRIGYFVNLAVISGFDIGFILFVLLPGHIDWTVGAWGPLLWNIGAAAGGVVLWKRGRSASHTSLRSEAAR